MSMKMNSHAAVLKNDLQKRNKHAALWVYISNTWQLYAMLFLPLTYYLVFHYAPLYGVLIAFKDYNPRLGVWGSEWIGLKYFELFLKDPYFYKLIRNTLFINLYSIAVGFTTPIIFALLLNEIQHFYFKKIVQTVSYFPHFISTVVICGMLVNFLARGGIINDFIEFFGGERIGFLQKPEYFRTIFVGSDIWQNLGWNSIIYIAALSNVDIELYDAAYIEGVNRFQKNWYISLPQIMPTIMILFIMRIGNLMNLGYEKILLLYSGATFETADVISTYVYRRGLEGADFSYATAVGLFQSVIALILLTSANYFSKKLGQTSLW